VLCALGELLDGGAVLGARDGAGEELDADDVDEVGRLLLLCDQEEFGCLVSESEGPRAGLVPVGLLVVAVLGDVLLHGVIAGVGGRLVVGDDQPAALDGGQPVEADAAPDAGGPSIQNPDCSGAP
jgi:hypothetical protein